MTQREEAAKQNLRKLVELLFQKRLARMPQRERMLLDPVGQTRAARMKGNR